MSASMANSWPYSACIFNNKSRANSALSGKKVGQSSKKCSSFSSTRFASTIYIVYLPIDVRHGTHGLEDQQILSANRT
jgi:hypothetical protein